MSYAFQYLKEHLKLIFMQGLFVCVFAVVFYFYHLPLAAVLYPTAICFLFGIFFTCQSFIRHMKRIKGLGKSKICMKAKNRAQAKKCMDGKHIGR